MFGFNQSNLHFYLCYGTTYLTVFYYTMLCKGRGCHPRLIIDTKVFQMNAFSKNVLYGTHT